MKCQASSEEAARAAKKAQLAEDVEKLLQDYAAGELSDNEQSKKAGRL